ncbi:MAG: peptidoglycan DD-metalloendopeptidase family protein [Patescibacteria group bacterium]
MCTQIKAFFLEKIRAFKSQLKNRPKNLIKKTKLGNQARIFILKRVEKLNFILRFYPARALAMDFLAKPLVFVGLAVIINLFGSEKLFSLGSNRVFGGPADSGFDLAQVKQIDSAFAAGQADFSLPFSFSIQFYRGAVLGWSQPLIKDSEDEVENESFANRVLFSYLVQEGDTLESLAAKFSIDKDTIIWANNLKDSEIQSGDYLIILPISGVLHEVDQGETLAGLAEYYNVAEERIVLANNLFDQEQVMPGEKLIIPGGLKKQKLSLNQTTGSFQGFFRMPTTGWNWGRLHSDNAVDIANSCGTPVYASADGYIEQADSVGWNNGYGNYILISHRNNLETLYAHLSAIFVSPGAYVSQGDLIGAIGNTGKVDGYTGCHLHFEVHGAANPFAR